MRQPATNGRLTGLSLSAIVGVVADRQTYRNLLYVVLAFPLGLLYYVILITGFSLGLALLVLVVGAGVLVALLVGLRSVASFERGLANRLLGTTIPAPEDVDSGGGLVASVRGYLRASSTWRGLGFVMLKFWLGLASFVLLVALLGTAIDLTLVPVFPGGALNVTVGGWAVAESIETTTQQALAVPAGLVLGLVALHALNGFARVNAAIAESLLGPSR